MLIYLRMHLNMLQTYLLNQLYETVEAAASSKTLRGPVMSIILMGKFLL